jgi:chemotaxis protein CheD
MNPRRASTPVGVPTGGAPATAESARKPASSSDGVTRRQVNLYAGQVFASREPAMVTTILGSCVAVCLWDVTRKTGGINHFLLPERVEGGLFTARFASVACEQLLAKMVTLGSEKRNLHAKVFGGASVLDALRDGLQRLGERNVETALAMLAGEQIPVMAQDVGGRFGRKLVFFTDTGVAWVKAIQRGPDGA